MLAGYKLLSAPEGILINHLSDFLFSGSRLSKITVGKWASPSLNLAQGQFNENLYHFE